MQVDAESKIVYVHIPRTGGSWFTFAWASHYNGRGHIYTDGAKLVNNKNGRQVQCGRHGRLSGILEKLNEVQYDISDHKIITIVRDPIDRIGSSWIWFSQVKNTALRHGWKSIDDMLDEFESGQFRANYMPQVYWLAEPGAKFDIIYKFEDLVIDNSAVLKDFPKFNRGKRDHNKLTRLGNRTSGLSTQTKERIKDLYSEDFKFLEAYYPQ